MTLLIVQLFLYTGLAVLSDTSPLLAEELPFSGADRLFDVRLETTTYVLNLEKQGLQDNTFTNGYGRDTTLIGDLLNVTAHRRLASRLDLDLGVFSNIPFGHDTVVSQVRPIFRLEYRPVDQVSTRLGTLRVPHREFLDAVFDDANRFVRPIEQGAQVTANWDYYRQDAFINWAQAFAGSAPNRFDWGYAGQLRFGPLRFDGQVHWVENGQALLKLDRSFRPGRNIVSAFGPGLVLSPGRDMGMPEWFREIGVRASYLNSYDEADNGQGGSIVRGRGYLLQTWLDLDGWRPRLGFWRGTSFVSQQGDPEFAAGNFMELGLSKTLELTEDASIEIGAQARHITNFVSVQGVKASRWMNQEYIVFNWNWDTRRTGRFFSDVLSRSPASATQSDEPSSRRLFTPMLDSLTYVYNVALPGVTAGGLAASDGTFAGQYLTPVLRYMPSASVSLDAGVFVGLPVGTTQSFHAVQPVLSATWEMLPEVSLVAGTLYRNHYLVDAIFDDATLFSRPIEQGFQLLVNRPAYQQDLFISWNQLETVQKPELFDVGYSGRLAHKIFGLNGQVYWAHSGGAQYSEARTFFGPGIPRDRAASNNFQVAVGPDLTIRPGDYAPGLSWFREMQVMALYFMDQNEPTSSAEPITRGRGYLLSAGVDLEGWRPYVNFWRGENYLTTRGDPAYTAGNFTEFGMLKDFVVPAGFRLRVGGLGRIIDGHVVHTEYALLNWSWDGMPWRGFCLRPTLLHSGEQPCGF
ncbi:hypothetical protein [Petrachloros mirabilis]